ncbi:MAG: thermonuclease family protein [Acidobacteria bacterium]|nr:thermonuclease family protein [Acidobacteriota bacterium]
MQILAKLLVVTTMFFSTCLVRPEAVSGTSEVVGVSDGDTITVIDHAKNIRLKIRLATIDAPESNQAFGARSKQSLSELVYKKNVTLKSFGNDKYGRVIAEVFVDGKNINVEQIKRGLAWHYKHHEKQQTAAERLIYSKAQDFAKENRIGLWAESDPVPPWDFRKEKAEKTPKPTKYLFIR